MSQLAQVAELVRALALGWRNLAAYPPGHPALAASLQQLQQRLDDLRGPAGEVVFGIAADGLIAAGEKIETPQAQKFANALYTRGVALLRFEASTTLRDLEVFLRLLSAQDGARPIFEELTASGVTSIFLQPVDYSSVQITDSLAETERKPASLWDDIVRALAEGNRLGTAQASDRPLSSVDPLSALLSQYADRELADAIGSHLAESSGLKRQFVLGQITQLLRSLPEALRAAVIRSVLKVIATDEAAGPMLRDFTTALNRDEVLDGLRHLAVSTKLSSHAAKLLEAVIGSAPATAPGPQINDVVAELSALFGEDDVDRFNPEDHQRLLESVAVEIPVIPTDIDADPARLGDRAATVADEVINRQVVHTVLEMLGTHGSGRDATALLARVEKCFRNFVENAQFEDAIDVVRRLRAIETSTPGVDDVLARMTTPDALRALVTSVHSAQKDRAALIQRLIDALGTTAAQNLLVALAEEDNRSRRRRLFDVVCSLGGSVVPVAASFLSDSRWFVVRNVILVLRAVGDRTTLPQIRRCAHHPDLRVRLEAIKTLLTFDSSVPTSLLDNAINDPDPKLAEAAIALVGSYGIKEGVGPLLKILDGLDVLGRRRALRIKAIKALGELADPNALLKLERFFPDPFLPWPSKEERRAAYESLAGYSTETRKRFVTTGLSSKDAQIRAICQRLAPKGAA